MELAINVATLVAYAAFAMDVLLQVQRVWVRKSSADISPLGLLIRVTAAGVILVKLILNGDIYLLLGHSMMVVLLLVYLVLVLRYRTVL